MSVEEILTRAPRLIIGLPFALVLAAFLVKGISDGEFGTKGGVVSKAERPLMFWVTVGAIVVAFAISVFGALTAIF